MLEGWLDKNPELCRFNAMATSKDRFLKDLYIFIERSAIADCSIEEVIMRLEMAEYRLDLTNMAKKGVYREVLDFLKGKGVGGPGNGQQDSFGGLFDG